MCRSMTMHAACLQHAWRSSPTPVGSLLPWLHMRVVACCSWGGCNGRNAVMTQSSSQRLLCWRGKMKTWRAFQERKFSPKRKFLAGYPCGHPAKNFGQALQILEKQAFWNGHPTRTSMKKLRSEKLRADFPFPSIVQETTWQGYTLKRAQENLWGGCRLLMSSSSLRTLALSTENRGVPSDGLRRCGLSIPKTQGKSEAQMPSKQGSNASVTKLPFQWQDKPALGIAREKETCAQIVAFVWICDENEAQKQTKFFKRVTSVQNIAS